MFERECLGKVFLAVLNLVLPIVLLGASPPGLVTAQAPSCNFTLGFRALHDLIPAAVGDCLENERHNPENGDGLQATTGGLLVWRKADNWTAFTNGHMTWINGPYGLERRLNEERFAWEGSPPSQPSGIEGQTLLRPTCPGPIRPGVNCERPYQATVAVLDQSKRQITRFETDAEGRFRVALSPGSYTLQAESPGPLPFARPQSVTVSSGQFTQVTITYDTGIR